jgi:hypothetical protein
MRRAAVLLVLPLLLVAAACGDDTDRTATGDRGAAEGVAIRISVGGGFVPQGLDFAAVPTVVLHDGTVFTGGAVTLQYPGPALSPVVTGRLSARQVEELLEAAEAARLDEERDYGMPGVTDMASTTIELDLDGRTATTSIYALGTGGMDFTSGLTDEQRAARDEATRFVQEVDDAVRAAATEAYVPAAYQVQAFEAGEPEASDGAMTHGEPQEPQPNELDWPLAGPLETGRCTEVTGADAEALTGALESATSITRWRSAGQVFTIAVKTVLPGTEPCPTA